MKHLAVVATPIMDQNLKKKFCGQGEQPDHIHVKSGGRSYVPAGIGVVAAAAAVAVGAWVVQPTDVCQVLSGVSHGELSRGQNEAIGACPADRLYKMAVDVKAKDVQSSLLFMEKAAGKGSAVAARSIAEYYDPALWSPASSPFSRSDRRAALKWYVKAASLGDAAASERASRLERERPTETGD